MTNIPHSKILERRKHNSKSKCSKCKKIRRVHVLRMYQNQIYCFKCIPNKINFGRLSFLK